MKSGMVCALEKLGEEHQLKRITLKREDLQVIELDDFLDLQRRKGTR